MWTSAIGGTPSILFCTPIILCKSKPGKRMQANACDPDGKKHEPHSAEACAGAAYHAEPGNQEYVEQQGDERRPDVAHHDMQGVAIEKQRCSDQHIHAVDDAGDHQNRHNRPCALELCADEIREYQP